MIDIETFRKNYLVVGLTDDQIQEIADLATMRRLLAGETLVRAGDQSSDLYVILSGHLLVMTPDKEKLNEVGPGSVIGEISLVDARPRTADVQAKGFVDVAVIPADALRQKMSHNREWGFVVLANIARVMAGRLRQANQKIDELYDKTTDLWQNAL